MRVYQLGHACGGLQEGATVGYKGGQNSQLDSQQKVSLTNLSLLYLTSPITYKGSKLNINYMENMLFVVMYI